MTAKLGFLSIFLRKEKESIVDAAVWKHPITQHRLITQSKETPGGRRQIVDKIAQISGLILQKNEEKNDWFHSLIP